MEIELLPAVSLLPETLSVLVAPGGDAGPGPQLQPKPAAIQILFITGIRSGILSRLDRGSIELNVRRAFTSVQLRTILEENHHPFLVVERHPLLYERTRDMAGRVAQAMKQASTEATILLYASMLDRHMGAMAELADRVFGFYDMQRAWLSQRRTIAEELVGQAEAQGTKALRKPQAAGAGDGQGDSGRGLRRPALRCGGDDTAEAGGEEMGE